MIGMSCTDLPASSAPAHNERIPVDDGSELPTSEVWADDRLAAEEWTEVVSGTLARGEGVEGALAVLAQRETDQGWPAPACSPAEMIRAAEAALEEIYAAPARLGAVAMVQVRQAFRFAQTHEREHRSDGDGDARILPLMAQHGLAVVDGEGRLSVGPAYVNAVKGRVVTYQVVKKLELMATVWLPDLVGMVVLAPATDTIDAPESPSPSPSPSSTEPDYPEGPVDYKPVGEMDAGEPPEVEDGEETIENPWFTVRGHDRSAIYVYHHERKMVIARGAADWPEAALTSIAPLQWWQLHFSGEKGLDKKSAINWLQRLAFKRGYYDPDMVRGRGAWRDDGRFVYHFGHRLWVDGNLVDVGKMDSEYIYEQAKRMRLPAGTPLSDAEGTKLFETFRTFGWTRPASAVLLAGYCALAPVGGALRWRPHVWCTGPAGCGKTSILNFVNWLMNGTALYAQGNSTEAGIRQTLKTDSRPVLFDESEQNNERETLRMQNVLSLIRQSSTESAAQTLKGTQSGEAQHFHIRSMFCLGSIQVGLKQQADMERISVLSLKSARKAGLSEEEASERAAKKWAEISAALAAIQADPELPGKLQRRALTLLPTTVENIEVFARAAAENFGSQRDGDQYGTLMAGAWSLCSSKVATVEEARAMIDRYDWSEYLEGSETEESEKALNTLLGKKIRIEAREFNVGELIQRVADPDHSNCDAEVKKADEALRRAGIWVKPAEDVFLVANKHPGLDDLMQGTQYSSDLSGQLGRLEGASPYDSRKFLGGVSSRSVAVPLHFVFDRPKPAEAQQASVAADDFGDDIAF
jgi:putative DNA primase/helicase